MKTVNVYDSIMGSGKTEYIISMMNNRHGQSMMETGRRFLYVTPMLDEIDRVKRDTGGEQGMDFRDPEPKHGSKFWHLNQLLAEGQNIATTHELFKKLTTQSYDLIVNQKYTLVIDEVITCCDVFSGLSLSDQTHLFKNDMVFIEEKTKRLKWNEEDHGDYEGRFDDIRNLCKNGNLCVYGDTEGSRKQIILWQFPIEFLECFDEVFVLTYLFEGSPMRSYLEAEGVDFRYFAVEGEYAKKNFRPTDWYSNSEAKRKAKIKELVTIYEGPLNDIGDDPKLPRSRKPLSKNWIKRGGAESIKPLKAKTTTWFTKYAKTTSDKNAWTTFADHRIDLKGAMYSNPSCWIALNTKATNQFSHKTSMAYLANRYSLPIVRNFFNDKGIPYSEDIFALSEMIQVLWRTAIRNNEPVQFYIPSERMRNLFKLWLSTDNTTQLIRAIGKANEGRT